MIREKLVRIQWSRGRDRVTLYSDLGVAGYIVGPGVEAFNRVIAAALMAAAEQPKPEADVDGED